jgi:hypothetical protein
MQLGIRTAASACMHPVCNSFKVYGPLHTDNTTNTHIPIPDPPLHTTHPLHTHNTPELHHLWLPPRGQQGGVQGVGAGSAGGGADRRFQWMGRARMDDQG